MLATGDRATTARLTAALVATMLIGAPSALADITVTTTSDSSTADGQCSLREAVVLSAECPGAALNGTTIINVPAGTYTLTEQLTIAGSANLDIRGASASDPSQTTIQRLSDAAQFRLMLLDDGGTMKLSAMTLTGGHAPDGAQGASVGTTGGNGAPGVAGSPGGAGLDGIAGGDGGAIHNNGSLTIDRVVIKDSAAGAGGAGRIGGDGGKGGKGTPPSNNGAVGATGGAGGSGGRGGNGGAIWNNTGTTLTITNSTLENNAAGPGGPGAGGGRGGDGGAGNDVQGDFGTGGAAGAGGPGGAMGNGGSGGAIFSPGTVVISSSTLRFNRGGMGGSFGIINLGLGGRGGDGGLRGAFLNGTGGRGGNGGAAGVSAPGGSGGAILSSGLVSLTRVTLHNNFGGDGSWGGGGGAAGNGGDGGNNPDPTNPGVAGAAGTPAAGAAAGCGGQGGAIFLVGVSPSLTISASTIWNNGGGNGGFGGAGGRGGKKGAFGVIGTSSAGAAGGTGGCGAAGGGLGVVAGAATVTNSTIGENRAGSAGTGGHGGNGADVVGGVGSAGGNAGSGGSGGPGGGVLSIRPLAFNAVTINANLAGNGGQGSTVVGTGTGGSPNGNSGVNGAPGSATQALFQVAGPVSFRNTIVRGLGPAPNCVAGVAVSDLGGNFEFPGGTPCPGTEANPQLDPIGEYGGPTRTYRLGPGSPAIDGGNDIDCQQVDQRGLARPQGEGCDSGAVEMGTPPVCQDVGPVHVPYGKKTNVQLVCSETSGVGIYDHTLVSPFPQNGEVRVVGARADGLWSYEPRAGFSGADSFGYYASSGNGDSATRLVTVNVTAPPAAPEVTGVSPGSPSNVAAPKVRGTATAGTTVSLYPTADCSGGAAGSGPATDFAGDGVTVGPLTEGTTTFRAVATDADGIASPCSSTSASYTYDGTAPAIQVISGPSGSTTDARPVFGFSSPEAGVTFSCSIDMGTAAFGACTGAGSHQPIAALAVGAYTFRVRATDAAGNAGVATRAFSIQGPGGTTPPPVPNTVIVKKPKAKVTTRSSRVRVTFTFRATIKGATIKGATFRCSLDGARPTACRSPKRYRVKPGRHRFTVRATAGGKTDPSPASYRFRVVRRR